MQFSDLEESLISLSRIAMARPYRIERGLVKNYYIKLWVDGVSEVVYLQYANQKQRDDDLAALRHLST